MAYRLNLLLLLVTSLSMPVSADASYSLFHRKVLLWANIIYLFSDDLSLPNVRSDARYPSSSAQQSFGGSQASIVDTFENCAALFQFALDNLSPEERQTALAKYVLHSVVWSDLLVHVDMMIIVTPLIFRRLRNLLLFSCLEDYFCSVYMGEVFTFGNYTINM